VAGELDKQVEFYVDNAEGELDRTVLERVVAPLEHMLRNAIDHGVETPADREAAGKPPQGTVVLSLTREGGEVVLRLTDDGRGIDLNAVREKAIARDMMAPSAPLSDHEIMQFILQPGFSTAKHVTQISGRGVGMDVVYSEIKQLGGSLEIDSVWGKGSQFTIRLPFTVSVNRALMVNVGGDIYAIPLNSIEGIVRVSPFELEAYYQPDAPLFEYAGQPYLMRYMGALLRSGDKPNLEGVTMPLPVLLVRGSDHSVAVQVDSLMGSREIVVKALGPQFGLVQGLSGATVLGDGSVVVILDLMALIRADALLLHRDTAPSLEDSSSERSRPLLVMVVDDSVTVRKVTSRFLERQGMEVMLAKDGVDAINLLQEAEQLPDVMLLDIEMPRMDGFEVASRVRHTSRLQDIPIIMITSRTGEKHRERAFSLGVNRYLGKPYQEMVLLETIHELMGTTVQQ
jgi:chemosensory pili system protein ChpA (sensor histidine kinase/response regulator)